MLPNKFCIGTWKKKKTHFQCFLDIRNTDKGLRIIAQKECTGKKSQNIRGATGVRSNELKLEQKEASTKSVLKKTVNIMLVDRLIKKLADLHYRWNYVLLRHQEKKKATRHAREKSCINMKQIAVCLIPNDLHRPSPLAQAKYFRITLSSSLTLQIQCHEILLVLPSE